MKYQEYHEVIRGQLEEQFAQEGKNIETAAKYCAESVKSGRVIHVFGCGHSQMFAMEVFYRAGGLVPVNALLIPHMALFPKAKLSTMQERIEGFCGQYLLEAKAIGMKVIALTSRQFSGSTTSRHSSGKHLADVADVVIDVKCVSGDAALSMDGLEPHFCGTSTVLGMAIMESIVAQTVENCVNAGCIPPIYVSSNLDKGDAINAQHIKNYSKLISCL